MIIPKEILDKWEKLRCPGDINKMADGDNTQRTYISLAMNGKECNESTFILIRDYFKIREALLQTAK